MKALSGRRKLPERAFCMLHNKQAVIRKNSDFVLIRQS